MGQPYLGEIRMFGGNFAPVGWALCNGQLLSIAEHDALFQLIGTTYGGDGLTTFALPDLRGRLALHRAAGLTAGNSGGTETVTLTESQLPVHSHVPQAQSAQGSLVSPTGGVWAASLLRQFTDSPPNAPMDAGALLPAGGGGSHQNMMPFLTITFIISLTGIFPSPS